MAHYQPDAVCFDAIPPFSDNVEGMRQKVLGCFPYFPEGFAIEKRDLTSAWAPISPTPTSCGASSTCSRVTRPAGTGCAAQWSGENRPMAPGASSTTTARRTLIRTSKRPYSPR
jgi:hypothetical protein